MKYTILLSILCAATHAAFTGITSIADDIQDPASKFTILVFLASISS